MKKNEILFGLITAIFLAAVISLFASSWPDGLEKVAEDKGFLEKGAVEPVFNAPLPDYLWPNLKDEKLATSLAGISGTLLVFGMSYGLAALIKRKKNQ